MVRLQVNTRASPAAEYQEFQGEYLTGAQTACAHGICAVGIPCALRFRCSCYSAGCTLRCSSCIFGSAFRAWCIHPERSAHKLAAANLCCTDEGAAVINLG